MSIYCLGQIIYRDGVDVLHGRSRETSRIQYLVIECLSERATGGNRLGINTIAEFTGVDSATLEPIIADMVRANYVSCQASPSSGPNVSYGLGNKPLYSPGYTGILTRRNEE